jgi:hypothetical protein
MHTRRIGPGSPGVSRLLGARLLLVVIAGFYLAGLVVGVMYLLGMDPLAHRW